MIRRNPHARHWRAEPLGDHPAEFHRTWPGYAPTPVHDLPALAAELGVGRVLVKDESARLGLPSFKILGASYAIDRALAGRGGRPRLVAATDGNHGRAVAHVARQRGLPADIFVPRSLTGAAKAAITGEGARLVELDLPYDDVVTAAAAHAEQLGPEGLLIQDTAWSGYTDVPQWIVDGYSTLFEELADQPRPDLVVVPAGVGSLAQAAVRHFRSRTEPGTEPGTGPLVATVEPENAPAIVTSLAAGALTSVPTRDTVMTGLNCGTPSANAWPYLVQGLDVAVTVTDAEAVRAVHDLRRQGVDAGPCGAAALAAARILCQDLCQDLGAATTVLLISTEGLAANPLPGDEDEEDQP
ncbi:pyridoxal-phosphate dependent enzyme [Dactylosporangium sp. AC04546]|uniref:pyridoxal-phosphate dependent enzyme n=1 Tax=Dactylosporangium sp. AC04546 TaxID=2862460 RepID=UPI001EDDA3A2|nr:pyridoxal-phosphate dependent enzyme [Dactylosporangium sp. AC04546]WVK79889.1 pyridoxal-phosphate dependent enzyme [Dactylosporangium sp. AC04546]